MRRRKRNTPAQQHGTTASLAFTFSRKYPCLLPYPVQYILFGKKLQLRRMLIVSSIKILTLHLNWACGNNLNGDKRYINDRYFNFFSFIIFKFSNDCVSQYNRIVRILKSILPRLHTAQVVLKVSSQLSLHTVHTSFKEIIYICKSDVSKYINSVSISEILTSLQLQRWLIQLKVIFFAIVNWILSLYSKKAIIGIYNQ